jgi:hypothetical protein
MSLLSEEMMMELCSEAIYLVKYKPRLQTDAQPQTCCRSRLSPILVSQPISSQCDRCEALATVTRGFISGCREDEGQGRGRTWSPLGPWHLEAPL